MALFSPFKQEIVSFFAFIRESYFCPPEEPLSTGRRFLYACSGSLLAGATIIVAFSLAADLTEYVSREARALQEAGVLQEGQVEQARMVLRREKGLLEAHQLQERAARLKASIGDVVRAKEEMAGAQKRAARARRGTERERERLTRTAQEELARAQVVMDKARREMEQAQVALLKMERAVTEANELEGFGIMPYLIGLMLALSLYFAWLVSCIRAKQGPLYLFVKGLVFTGFVLLIVQTIIERIRAAL